MPEITCRDATEADLPTIVRFVIAMARDSEDVILDEATVTAGARAVLADPAKGVYHLAEAGGEVVGQALVTTEWSDWNATDYWWIQTVYVRPDWRGRGVFDALYEHLRARARAAGTAALRLYVRRDNLPARRAYERAGMVEDDYLVYEEPLVSAPEEAP